MENTFPQTSAAHQLLQPLCAHPNSFSPFSFLIIPLFQSAAAIAGDELWLLEVWPSGLHSQGQENGLCWGCPAHKLCTNCALLSHLYSCLRIRIWLVLCKAVSPFVLQEAFCCLRAVGLAALMNEDIVSQLLVFCLEMHCFSEKQSIFFSKKAKCRREFSCFLPPTCKKQGFRISCTGFLSPFLVEEGNHPISLYAFDKTNRSGIHDRTKQVTTSRTRKAPDRQTGEGGISFTAGLCRDIKEQFALQ